MSNILSLAINGDLKKVFHSILLTEREDRQHFPAKSEITPEKPRGTLPLLFALNLVAK
jgi:hypothetical protein